MKQPILARINGDVERVKAANESLLPSFLARLIVDDAPASAKGRVVALSLDAAEAAYLAVVLLNQLPHQFIEDNRGTLWVHLRALLPLIGKAEVWANIDPVRVKEAAAEPPGVRKLNKFRNELD